MMCDRSPIQLCIAALLSGALWAQLGFGQQAGTGSQPVQADALGAADLKVGVAKAVITPPVTEADRPVWLAGFDPGRRAMGVHDDLYARALFLESGKQRVAIVALDFVGYDYMEVRACRALLKTRHPELADVHLLIASTHNHQGPDTMGIWGPLPMVSGVDRAYLDQVRHRIADVVAAAARGATLARVRFAEAPTRGLIGDSRPPKVINETIHAMHAERMDNGQPIGSLLLWHSHPEDLGSKNTLITADFPKYAIDEMESALGGTTVYLSGTVGGLLSPSHVRLTDEESGAEIPQRTFAHAEAIGRRAARVAIAAIRQAKPVCVEQLDLKVKELDLPLGNPAYRVGLALRSLTPRPLYTEGKPDPRTELLAERVQRDPMLRAWMDQAKERLGVAVSLLQRLALPIGEDIRTELNVITLGPAQFITIPGELYPELAIEGIPNPPDRAVDFPDAPPEPALVNLMHGQYKFIIGLANDELGYILPKSEWDVQAPYAYGSTKPPYGEVFSLGPDTALRIAEAYRELLAGQEKTEGFVSLFNGKDLTGWKASENPDSFVVRDGMIVARGRPRSHLYYVGPVNNAHFKNFEFKVDVRTEPESNGGIYFHTRFLENNWPQAGCEVQVNTCQTEKRKTGSLYAIQDVTDALVKDNEWFNLHIIVRDKRVVVKVNGKTVVDWTQPADFRPPKNPTWSDRRLSAGTFALQAHDPKSVVYYKNIRVKPLDSPAAGESWVNPPQKPIPGVEHRTFHSVSMQRAVRFNIYLPLGYADSDKRFPVVYYLHGMTDCQGTHPQLFAVFHKVIRAGECRL